MRNPPRLVSTFVAERFSNPERLSDFVSPPYDVITPARRAALAEKDVNIVRLILPEGNGDRYERARDTLHEWRRQGVLVRDRKPGVYVLRQEFDAPDGRRHARTGLLAGVAAEPYDGGRVRPHERTHAGPKADRLALLRSTGAMMESLLMISPDEGGALEGLLQRSTGGPRLSKGDLDGVEFSLWQVGGREASRLADSIGGQFLYIADGHHRYETAVAYRRENPQATHTLALIVPQGDPGLVVLPTHRVLEGPPLTEGQLRRVVEDVWEVVALEAGADVARVLGRLAERSSRGCVVVLKGEGVFALTERTGTTLPRMSIAQVPAVQRLDVTWVDTSVVEPLRRLLGGEAAVRYTADAREAVAAVEDGAAAAVCLNPTTVPDVFAVADAGAVMPPKTTYFAPKVPSGLVIMGVG